ncbi:taurine catabolism dioxygenase TauD [Chitinophaga agrisoli]|uniref:Taurine catabolism dioxygenase TauD n=1 Tax=Chitinophaga agrisoli TaxID=2607653 RepID=A0A5B2W3N2_9BACT|nr:taurine catabolism dioxygenase TauD [Chitinophaga agrisoli]KAA2245744.1 taurine catabolism dioxygenase TauD [Chitinophaga agrisoli]
MRPVDTAPTISPGRQSMSISANLADTPPLQPLIIDVTEEERLEITYVGKKLKRKYKGYENPEFVAMLHLNAYTLLPERIATVLSSFGTDFSAQQYGAIILRGLVEIGQAELGPTPPSWQETDYNKIVEYGFISSLLHGAVPSKPVEYYAQRKGGGLMHAIIPDEKMSHTQTGSGSRTDLFVHTEDAFLYNAADFLSFLFLRNEERVPSTLYSIRSHGRPNARMQELFKPIYKCPKDANYEADDAISEATRTSILYGNEAAPFMRFDAAEQIYNEQADQDPEALRNLVYFWEEARELIYNDFIPESGDLIFVNNHLCAHGRNAFLAGFREEYGQLVKCERRIMLRMMSKTSLINIRAVTHPENPYLIMEEHYGKIYRTA